MGSNPLSSRPQILNERWGTHERTGSPRFRKLIEAEDYDSAEDRQTTSQNGANVIGVNFDAALLDGELHDQISI